MKKRIVVIVLVALVLLALFAGLSGPASGEGLPPAAERPEVGQMITLGCYEQDNNPANGSESIEWLVLEVDGE